jgi:hypothetical protein
MWANHFFDFCNRCGSDFLNKWRNLYVSFGLARWRPRVDENAGFAYPRRLPRGPAKCQLAMIEDMTPNSVSPTIDVSRAPNRSAAWPPRTMQAAEATR